jgi:hypothetical protein
MQIKIAGYFQFTLTPADSNSKNRAAQMSGSMHVKKEIRNVTNSHCLLSDTKLAENIIELVFVGNGTGYFAQIMQAAPDVKGYQIA